MLEPESPVVNVSVTETRSQQVTLSWSDNNAVVDDYIVTYDNKAVNSTTKFLTVTGLDPFTSYNFTVQARNSAGTSSIASGSFTVVKTGASGMFVGVQTWCETLFN